jgi:hypothetical protein
MKLKEVQAKLLRLPVAMLRQLPVTLAVAKLPIPYNFTIPCLVAGWKTIQYKHQGMSSQIVKYYFKTLSRTIFGLSLRRFVEHTAKYTLTSQFGISDEVFHVVGIVMILVCVLLDATS